MPVGRLIRPRRRSCRRSSPTLRAAGLALALSLAALPARAVPGFLPEEVVQADGVDLLVNGYSVPSFVDWNNDGRKDLIVGEGGGLAVQGKVRVYLNVGTASDPSFSTFFYAQSAGFDLWVPATGCLGIYPRVVYWDGDERKDLLAGDAAGKVRLFTNVGTDDAPAFGQFAYLQVGLPGQKVDIAVGARATPDALDWNQDGRKDLVVGALDGKIRIYLNEGTDAAPDFRTVAYAQDGGADLSVPTGRSAPCFAWLEGEVRDLVTGNTEGQLLWYRNVGTDAAPAFSGYEPLSAAGMPIDLAGSARSRPYVCDWTGDGQIDLLIGSGDGLVRLFRSDLVAAVETAMPASLAAVRWLPGGPNPARPGARLGWELPRAGRVRVDLYNPTGARVLRLLESELPAGAHAVDLPDVDAGGRRLPRGVYYLTVEAAGARDVRRVVVLP